MLAPRVFVLLFCALVYGNPQRIIELRSSIFDLEDKLYESVRELASYNDPVGLRKLAEMYETGTDRVMPNESEAFRIYSTLRDAVSIYKVGVFNLFGMVARVDHKEALKKFRESEALGYVPAINKIGRMYFKGEGVRPDMQGAINQFDKASKLGSALAMVNLGMLFECGKGLPKNNLAAAGFYQLAAEKGHTLNSDQVALANLDKGEAMFTLGSLYESGKILKLDLATALKYYEKAALLGHLPSIKKLVWMYATGKGTLPNRDEAKKWCAIMLEDHPQDVETFVNRCMKTSIQQTQNPIQDANMVSIGQIGVLVEETLAKDVLVTPAVVKEGPHVAKKPVRKRGYRNLSLMQ